MSLEDLYREVILDHHQHPRCHTPIHHHNAQSSGMNPSCGDEVTVTLNITGDRIDGVHVDGKGCAISTASGSMFADKLQGMTTKDAKALADAVRSMLTTGNLPADEEIGDMEALAGVSQFPVRVKCAMLPIVTAIDAVASFEAGDNGRDA